MERIAVWAGLLVGLEGRSLDLQFRQYRRQFVQPLQTAHGPWRDRQGLIVRLQTSAVGDDQARAYGEIAPIPWFGTETLEEAIAFLTQLQSDPAILTLADLSAIVERSPAQYSATRFGLGLAIAQLQGNFPLETAEPAPQRLCALLPARASALAAWPTLWNQGHRTFKWKIGMADLAQEGAELETLRRSLPPPAKLRLDANGGFSIAAAKQCLNHCDDLATQGLPIEFLEQPLPPTQFEQLLQLSQSYRTPLALDESVTGLAQLADCHRRGWRGIFVVKGAIAGDPLAVVNYCRQQQLKVVFSSVFETGLARQAVLAMAQAVQAQALDPEYALGFGVGHWLQPDGLDGQNLTDPDLADPDLPGQDQPTDLRLRGDILWRRLAE